MEEFVKMLQTLNYLCEVLNKKGEAEYSVTDWVFGFIVFENNEKVCDGNFSNVVKYLAAKI